jgi:hypothetical protein
MGFSIINHPLKWDFPLQINHFGVAPWPHLWKTPMFRSLADICWGDLRWS